MITGIAAIVIALFALVALHSAQINIIGGTEEQKNRAEIAKLEIEINSTCAGEDSTGTTIKVGEKEIKLAGNQIYSRSEGEDYSQVGTVKCFIEEKEVISDEGITNPSGIYVIRTEKTENEKYRVQ